MDPPFSLPLCSLQGTSMLKLLPWIQLIILGTIPLLKLCSLNARMSSVISCFNFQIQQTARLCHLHWQRMKA